jgi:hypothetical protein
VNAQRDTSGCGLMKIQWSIQKILKKTSQDVGQTQFVVTVCISTLTSSNVTLYLLILLKSQCAIHTSLGILTEISVIILLMKDAQVRCYTPTELLRLDQKLVLILVMK